MDVEKVESGMVDKNPPDYDKRRLSKMFSWTLNG
jgi:hypothetical protein